MITLQCLVSRNTNSWRDQTRIGIICFYSKLFGFNRKSNSPMMYIPSSVCHGIVVSLTTKTFLKASFIISKERVSCSIFSLSGMEYAT